MNRMFIQPLEQNFSNPLVFPLISDFTIEAKSEFSSFGELLPGVVGDMIKFVTTTASTGGVTGSGIEYMNSVIDMKRWTKTNPISINTTLKFYLKDNVYNDVFKPTVFFMSMGVLTVSGKNGGTYYTPGPNLNNLGDIAQVLNGNLESGGTTKKFRSSFNSLLNTSSYESDTKFYPKKNKMMSVWIPGVVYIPIAFVESCTPTFSNQIVKSTEKKGEYPLWASVDLQITGITPATDDMLMDSSKLMISDSTLGAEAAALQQTSQLQSAINNAKRQ